MSLKYGLSVNDFIGEIRLDLSNDNNVRTNFEAIANQVMDDVLRDLMNDSLYNNFIADLVNNIPQTQKYLDLLNGKTYTRTSGEKKIYEGLKRMLRYFVYEAYIDFQHTSNSSLGQTMANTENSQVITRGQLRKVRSVIQNKAVNLYGKAIQFINDNYQTYFTGSDYSFWKPTQKRYLGKITSMTFSNLYFYNKSSESN